MLDSRFPADIPMADAIATAERTLPHNLEAERSVLGAILVHNDAFNTAAQVIDGRDFYRDAHRRIFDRMVALNERGDVAGARSVLADPIARTAESEQGRSTALLYAEAVTVSGAVSAVASPSPAGLRRRRRRRAG